MKKKKNRSVKLLFKIKILIMKFKREKLTLHIKSKMYV